MKRRDSGPATGPREPSRLRFFILFALVALLGACLRVHNLGTITTRSVDEQTYTGEARAVLDDHGAGLHGIAVQFQKNQAIFEVPSPARAGYIYSLAAAMDLSGNQTIQTGAALACAADIATLLLLGVLGRRLLGERAALVAMLLYAVSPPVLAMARRSWEESLLGCMALLLFFAALEAARRDSLWLAGAVGALAGLAFTFKEVTILHAALIVTALAIFWIAKRCWKQVAVLAGSWALVSILALAWVAHILGGWGQVLFFIRKNIQVTGTVPYAIQYQSGSWAQWFAALWQIDPVVVSLALIGIVAAGLSLRNGIRVRSLLWPAAIVVLFAVLPGFGEHHYNLRFAYPIFCMLCLLAGSAAKQIGDFVSRYGSPQTRIVTQSLLVLMLLLSAWIGYSTFQEQVARTDMLDLSLRMLQANAGL